MNILIINLRRFGDIFASGHLIKSFRESNPGANISMLVYQEFSGAAKILNGVDHIHTIDRKKCISLKCNPIFSDGHALNSFMEDIEPITNIKWDQVVNYSNDEVGTMISSYMQSAGLAPDIRGVFRTKFMSNHHSSEWSLLFNDVLTGLEHPVIHFADCYQHICELGISSDKNKLKVDVQYQQQVEQNLRALRNRESSGDIPVRLVGIHLKSADERKNLPVSTMIDLVGEIMDDPSLYPIMLIAPNSEERSLANQINEPFNNKLVAIEASFSALVSVLKEIDILVTPDTAPKHMADLTATPVIEIATGPAPMRKQGTYRPENLVVTTKLDCAPCLVKGTCHNEITNKCCNLIQASDIISAVNAVLSPSHDHLDVISNGVTIYRSKRDELGTYYHPIAGAFNKLRELSIMMSRVIVQSLLQGKNGDYQQIVTIINDPMLIKSWIRSEKTAITRLSKSLLNAIRLTLHAQKSQAHVAELINATESLIEFSSQPGLSGLLGKMLRGKLDSFNGNSFEANITEMESLLYSIKNDIQVVIRGLDDLHATVEKSISPATNITLSREAAK